MHFNKTLIIDFDGTIYTSGPSRTGQFMPGAVDSISQLLSVGWRCIISSCVNNPSLYHNPAHKEKSIRHLFATFEKAELPGVVIDRGDKGKPVGTWYIDDRGLLFNGNWSNIINYMESLYLTGQIYHQSHLALDIGIEGCVFNKEGDLVPETKEALSFFMKNGYHIILSTIQSNRYLNPNENKREHTLNKIRKKIDDLKIHYNWLDDGSFGKPIADFYIETNMITFRGSWSEVINNVLFEDKKMVTAQTLSDKGARIIGM